MPAMLTVWDYWSITTESVYEVAPYFLLLSRPELSDKTIYVP